MSNKHTVIRPDSALLTFNFKEVFKYRDLLFLFVKRDFISVYKQTILGPLWFFIQPVFATLIFSFVFGRVGGFAPEGVPSYLYYLSGIVLWQYFADCLTKTSDTFIMNQKLFGKVYFPRLIVPLSIVVSNMIKLGIQMVLLLAVYIIFFVKDGFFALNAKILLTPVFILMMAGFGMAFGLIITSMTTKYRDLKFLIVFGVQLLMYMTPGIITSYELIIKQVPEYGFLFKLNPLGSIIEGFKYSLLSNGYFSWTYLGYSFVFMIIVLFIGILLFNKVEKDFMDTV